MNYSGPFRVRIDENSYPEFLHPKVAIVSVIRLYLKKTTDWFSLTVRANQASVNRFLPRLIKNVMDGTLNPKEMLTHRKGLRDVSEAYRMFSAKLDNMIKQVLVQDTVI